MSDHRIPVFEANMAAALRRWHKRRGGDTHDPGIADTPFESLLMKERERADSLLVRFASKEALTTDELRELRETYEHPEEVVAYIEENALEGEPGEYEWRQRVLGIKLVFRWILAEGFHPLKIMKRLFAVGRALHLEPFTRMTMTEQALMFSEERATCSWRMKVLSGLIRLRGMAGHRLPGQKTDRAVDAARQAAKGNRHRAGSVRGGKARQGSFLRKLHVPAEGERLPVSQVTHLNNGHTAKSKPTK